MLNVLLIDDDDDIIQLNRMTLEAKGHQVSAARSAQEGWDALAKGTPDVIILDVMMEEFNAGFTLAQDISIKYPRVPMIMLTSVREHMNESWKFSPEKDGGWIPVKRFLEKPVEPKQMLHVIDEVVKEAAAKR